MHTEIAVVTRQHGGSTARAVHFLYEPLLDTDGMEGVTTWDHFTFVAIVDGCETDYAIGLHMNCARNRFV
jgi:hypothetical protein